MHQPNVVATSTAGAWRGLAPRAVDILIALALGVLMLGEAGSSGHSVFYPALLLAPVSLAWRRRQPLPVFFLVMAGVAVAGGWAAPYGSVTAAMIAAYSVGAHDRRRLLSLAAMVITATVMLTIFGGRLPAMPEFAGPYLLFLPLWLAGNAIQTRQLRADAFESKATRLEREQELATRQAMAEERAYRPRAARRGGP